jgi:hypothetical protein
MKALKRILIGSAVAAALAVPVLTPAPAAAWGWHGGYGWHGGWGWHGYVGWHPGWAWHPGWGWGGVYVGVPPVVVAPGPAYGAPYHFIPAHYAPNGAFIPAHWGYY